VILANKKNELVLIDKFRVVKKLYDVSNGTFYIVYDSQNKDDEYLIKLSSEPVDKLLEEVSFYQLLQKNSLIVPLKFVKKVSKHLMFVFDKCDVRLKDMLDEGQFLSEKDALMMIKHILRFVEFAHQKKLPTIPLHVENIIKKDDRFYLDIFNDNVKGINIEDALESLHVIASKAVGFHQSKEYIDLLNIINASKNLPIENVYRAI
jgi:serine/threonine protein kinase